MRALPHWFLYTTRFTFPSGNGSPTCASPADSGSTQRRRTAELAAIDEDWNPGKLGWTLDWQRHHVGLEQLLAAGARLTDIVPRVTHHGEDIGRWLATQRRDFGRLNAEQQARLGNLDVKPAARARKTTVKTGTKPTSARGRAAFQKGLEAFAQYVAREGTPPWSAARVRGQLRWPLSRAHTETLPDGTQHRTGIWIANQKARRDQLHTEQLHALADLGVDWAR